MSTRRATPITITFPLVDTSNRPLRKAGLSFSSSWVYLINPAFVAPPTNLPYHLYAGRYALALTAAEMDFDWVHVMVEAPGCDPFDQLIGTSGHPSATVVGGGTATAFQTTLLSAVDDYWRNCLLTFTTGALANQVRKVVDFDGTTKTVTVDTAFTDAPADGDRFILVNI